MPFPKNHVTICQNVSRVIVVFLSQIFRACRILTVWLKFGLGDILFSSPAMRRYRFLGWFNPFNWFRSKKYSKQERLRLALETLGPLYVKFGQLLSTRRDILSDELATELSALQDHVGPFDGKIAVKIIEAELGQKIEDVFSEFDEKPLASASIAQVHPATLKDGQKVVVKVLRPNIEKQIRKDVSFLYGVAKVFSFFFKEAKRFRLVEVVKEIDKTLKHEVDLLIEAANGSALKRNFEFTDDVYIPSIIWPLCRSKVLVLERISGIPINDVKAIEKAGVDLKSLAENGVNLFYTQVFDHCFFHADLHPGNVFINADDPANPQFVLVDFGIVGSLTPEDKHYLAANFIAFFERDYRRVAKLHIDSGWVPGKTRLEEFEAAMRTVTEPIFEKPLKEISLGLTLMRLFQIAREFEMETLPQLLLMQKTLFNVESLARMLYPELNVWENCKPFLKQWMKKQVGTRGLWRRLKDEAPIISERLPELPGLLYQTLRKLNEPKPEPKKSYTFAFFVAGIALGGLLAWFWLRG